VLGQVGLGDEAVGGLDGGDAGRVVAFLAKFDGAYRMPGWSLETNMTDILLK